MTTSPGSNALAVERGFNAALVGLPRSFVLQEPEDERVYWLQGWDAGIQHKDPATELLDTDADGVSTT